MQIDDTISVVSTAIGEAAVGIIRISGKDALPIGEKIFKAKSKKKLGDYPVNTLAYGYVYDENDVVVDEVLAVFMKAPHSYTAEDVVEIQCHGGVSSLQEILRLTYKMGARPAEPGEFTKRAFLNGRLDLAQAEAVMDIIQSKSVAALKMATRQQKGELSHSIEAIRQQIMDIVVHLEAMIDYPEEDIEDITYENMGTNLKLVSGSISKLLGSAHTGKILRQGLRTAIVGRPNVGKSSLLNCLLAEERAIVSEIPGTTRDVIEEQLIIDGVPIVLSDTAGIRDTEDFVEKIGVEKSRKSFDDAELVIVVLDGSKPLTKEDRDILEMAKTKASVIIINKSDLTLKVELNEIKDIFGEENIVLLSAKTTNGLDYFKQWLKKYVYGKSASSEEGAYVQNARHEQLLNEALIAIETAIDGVINHLTYDLMIIDLKEAMDALGKITGTTIEDEVINQIFSRFCLGK
jgi:tRNA modification GTPase